MRLQPNTTAMTVVLGLLTAAAPLSTDMYLPSLPAIGVRLGATTPEVQWTLSVFLVGFAIGQILYGPLADRYGRKPVLFASIALFVVASAACSLAASIKLLIAARLFQAIGASGAIVLARAIVRDLYEGPRAAEELSRMGTIMGLVPAIAPVIGGVLERQFGWRASFLVTTAFAMALAGLVAMLPETLKTRGAAVTSPLALVRIYAGLFDRPKIVAYGGLMTFCYAGLFAFISGSSFVLQNIYGLNELVYGFAFGAVVIGYVAGTMIGTRLSGRRGIDGTIAVGVAALAAGGLAMTGLMLAGIKHPLAVVLPMAVYTCGVGMTMPQSMAGALMPFPDRAGAASSLVGFVQMLFAATIGILVGHGIQQSALPLALAIAAMGLAALALFLGTKRIRAA